MSLRSGRSRRGFVSVYRTRRVKRSRNRGFGRTFRSRYRRGGR